MNMTLAPEERAMKEGRRGPVLEFAIDLLERVGNLRGARHMLPIEAAYVGTSYAGTPTHLDFARWIHDRGAKVAVPTHTNVGGWDSRNPDIRVGPDAGEFNDRSRQLLDLHRAIGCTLSLTCAPYQLPSCPRQGANVACSESNAVSYFNSVSGVRTEKYGCYIDMAAALSGRVPAMGLHLDEARKGTLVFDVEPLPEAFARDDLAYQLIGHVIGRKAGKQVPVIVGLDSRATKDNLRSISAAAASSGAVEMYHAIGLTPEAPDIETATRGGECPRIPVSRGDLMDARREMEGFGCGKIDAVAIGTPHASLTELEALIGLLAGRKIRTGVNLFVQTNRFVREIAERKGWLATLEGAGAVCVADTCLYWRPATRGLRGRVMTTSGKFAYYSPGELGLSCRIATLRECVESAVRGEVWIDPALELGS